MSLRDLCLVEVGPGGDEPPVGVVDRYLEFVAARCRPNTVAATKSDLAVFFSVINKAPGEVQSSDILEFIAVQRRPLGDGRVVRLADGESGLSARTIKRRVASVSGFFGYLVIIGEVGSNPVPRGLSTRRRGRRGGVPLVRTPRTLPKVLEPAEVNALLSAVRRWRDRAMVEAMVVGGLRRCEVLGLQLEDCGRLSAGCSSPRARAVISGWCRSRLGSSRAWPAISTPSAPRRRRPIVSSLLSRVRDAGSR